MKRGVMKFRVLLAASATQAFISLMTVAETVETAMSCFHMSCSIFYRHTIERWAHI